MPALPLPSLDIAALSRAFAEGTLTPEAVIKEVYRRIGALGERPIWISIEPKEKALAALAAAPKGPLWGIPFAVKDNIDVRGIPTTCACPEFERLPARSATVVERLEAAGAILIGKTNLDQFATGLNGTRSPYGACTSPFNDAYISGGSSSGSAAAVARGLVSFALGTDTAGSGRVPAALNNLVGLKPTKGLLSTRGLVPACRSQDVISVFALTTSDAALVTGLAAGYDAEDPYSRQSPGGRFAPEAYASRPRIGIPDTLEFLGDHAAATLYAKAVDTLKGLGAEIVHFDLAPFLDAAKLLYAGPWVAERLAAIKPFAESHPTAIIEPVRKIILGARDLSATDAFEGLYQLAELVRATEPAWQAMDAMLLPTAPTTYKIDDMLRDPIRLNSNLGLYTNFVNLCDLAAIAVPAGFRPDGLPFGVTLIGPAFSDGRLAPVADQLHHSLAGAKLGATDAALSATPQLTCPPAKRTTVDVAVVGAHLTGQPLNSQLVEREATLLETARTARGYRLYALPGTTPPKPGLIFDGAGAGNLEVEIWRMSHDAFGSFVDLIPAPLGIGTLTLADGRTVKGFLCEAHATQGALEITAHGGWRAWLASR